MEGIGWLVSGDDDVNTAIRQIEKDSDRAAAMIAASIVEVRLTSAIQHGFQNHEDIILKLFRPSGPLGPFSNKIDLAYLLGLVSTKAYEDLVNMKNIRNDFAHKLDVLDFSTPSIRDRCANFRLVDEMVGDISREEIEELMKNPPSPEAETPHLARFIGATEALKKARQRFIMSAQILSWGLGMASNPFVRRPLV
jgi:DNA-binding MltR family transcriptional regulator